MRKLCQVLESDIFIDMYNYVNNIGIYKLTNRINGKIYIGKSLNLHRRILSHKNSENKNKPTGIIGRAIKKHKWINYDVEILESYTIIDDIELIKRETEYIRQFNSIDKKIGYNIREYGMKCGNHTLTAYTRKKMSESKKGKYMGEDNGFYGNHHTDDFKIEQSNRFSGEKNPMFGRKHSREMKEKMSKRFSDGRLKGEKNPMFGRKHTSESIAKMKLIRESNPSTLKKKVKQLDLKTGELIKIWDSLSEASTFLGKKGVSGISLVCSGKNRSAHGFKWEYLYNISEKIHDDSDNIPSSKDDTFS